MKDIKRYKNIKNILLYYSVFKKNENNEKKIKKEMMKKIF